MGYGVESLLILQKALDFADEVCAATEQFSRGYGLLVDQLNRVALSISAKIAEGDSVSNPGTLASPTTLSTP